MRYSCCRDFPMTINRYVPYLTKQSISTLFPVFSPSLLGSPVFSSPWLIQGTWSVTIFCGLKGGEWSYCLNETYDPHCQIMHFANSVKKETLVWCLHWISDCCAWMLILCEPLHKAVSTGKMSHESLKVWPVNLTGMMAAGRWRWEGKKLKSVCHLFEWRLLYIIKQAGRKEIKLLEPMSEA